MAAPLLTPSQFRKTDVAKRPGASYGGYVRYVTRTRAARAAGAGGGGYAGGSPEALASSDVNGQIAAALAGYRATTRAAQAQANRQAARAGGFAKALAGLTATTPAAERAIYENAAHQMNAYGTGLTGRTADLWNQEATQSQADVAKLTGGLGHVGGYDIPGLQNLSQFTGVTIPGSTLEEEGANAMVSAQARRAADAATIGQIAQSYRAKTVDLQNQLAAQRMALEAQRPSLYAKALSARQAVAFQQQQAAQQQANFMADYNEKVREFNAEQKRLGSSALAPKIIGSASGGYYMIDPRTGKVIRRVLGPHGTSPTGAPAGLTTKDVAALGLAVRQAYTGVRNPNYIPGIKSSDKNYLKSKDPYLQLPLDSNSVMRTLLTQYPNAYNVIYQAMLRYARLPGSRWDNILNWQSAKHGGTRK